MGYQQKLMSLPFWREITDLISGEAEVEERREAMRRVESYGEESMQFFLEALEEITQKAYLDEDDTYLMVLTMWYTAYKKETRAFPLLLQLSLKEHHLEAMSYNLEESYPYALYYTFNGDYDLLEKMILTPDRETYAECELIVAAVDLCFDGKVEKDRVRETLLKLLFSSYQEDDIVMEYVCMGICIAPFPELMPLVKVMLELEVCSNYDICDYAEYEDLLGNDKNGTARALFLPKAADYPLYEELEYLQPDGFE